MQIAVWQVQDGRPERLAMRRDISEATLESWIEEHPDLVVEGMQWVARQLVLPDDSRADLVGMTPEGQLVVAELKRGPLTLSTLLQALRYLLAIAAMDPDAFLNRLHLTDDDRAALSEAAAERGELDLAVLLVGTGKAPELDRATEFLSERGLDVPVRTVSFTPFADAEGGVLLAREVDDHEQPEEHLGPQRRQRRAASVDRVLEQARQHGVGEAFTRAVQVAEEVGCRVKPWPRAITIVPPFTHGRTLLYLSPREPGTVRTGYHPDNWAEIYDADVDEVAAALGENWAELSADEAIQRLEAFADLLRGLRGDDAA